MRAQEFTPRKLVIFDIDDTLVHTQTKVNVVKDGRVIKELNSHEFTHYKLQPGEQFDFGAFRDAKEFFDNAKPIIPMLNQLKNDIATGNKVVMVTARADFDDRELFLDTFRKYGVDMGKVHVYRAGNMTQKVQTEEKKKIIIRDLLNKGNYTKAIMYDDAEPNLQSFIELKKEYPNTKFYAWHVSLEGEANEYDRTNEDYHPNERPRGPEIKPTMPRGTVRVDVSDVYDWYKLGQHISDLKGLGKHDFGKGPPSTIFSFGDEDTEHKYINALKKTGLSTTDIDPPGHKKIKGQKVDPTYNVEEGKKRKRKQRGAAWGPGPYGSYGYDSGYSGGDGGGDGGGESIRQENMDHSKDGQAVPQLKAALIARKEKLQSATDDQVYDIIDKIMTRIAKTHGISGQKLHDMWVEKYKQVPDTWIMKENFADGKNPQDKGDSKRHSVPTKASVSTLRKVAKQGGRKGQLAHWMANMKAGRAKKK